ncbi:MAG: CoA-binding protein [Acidobacteria bacterium]|nr:CoA-binding protein [Acidobacteriota bacterium]NIM61581.1 CoA-binding protein [Acidobacteriota bacterium]NIO58145.1 CoA-binding protein [Acidobacteriota bacterium]NIQ29161.1 CoA-binding protein [Acidobacteriota bacterium]NIQ85073.1 CoA-binding protein [Acidobacteriota bacterium]
MIHPDFIDGFLEGGPFAVVGASRDRRKYGNKVLRCLLQHGREAYPVNPNARSVEGLTSYPDLRSLPQRVHAVSVITPPRVTERIVEDLPGCGAAWVWMQPGAESADAVARAERLGLGVISGGPCILVALGFKDEP